MLYFNICFTALTGSHLTVIIYQPLQTTAWNLYSEDLTESIFATTWAGLGHRSDSTSRGWG